MSKGKKKSKKPKLAAGAVLSQLGGISSGGAQERPLDEQALYKNDDKGRNVVSKVPIIGGLTGAVMGISSGLRGDGTSYAQNLAGTLFSPTSGMRAAKDAGASNINSIGAMLNPMAGAVMTSKLRKKQMADLARQRQVPIIQSMMANSGQGLAHGGVLDSGLQAIQGGELEPISKDAVQVKADNPNMEDSVELEQAFVDHNEVIDKKDRVFSDILTAPSGRTIAKEAKRLEKMKNSDSRFSSSNERIDGKLDELFDYQENMKKVKTKGKLAKGGEIDTWEIGGASQQNLAFTGWNNFNKRMREQANAPIAQPALAAPKKKFLQNADWQTIGTAAATAAPNIANAILQNRLKGPSSPQLETDIRLNRASADAQLADANRAYSQAKQVLTTNTGQGANLSSGIGNLLSKRLAAQNQTYGAVNNLNAQIGNQEAMSNQMVRARNIERTNQFRNNQIDFGNRKLAMTSENIANLSGKIQQFGRERNMMERDRQAFEFLQSAYGDSGVLERLAQKRPDLFASVSEALGKKSNKMGGKLSKKKGC